MKPLVEKAEILDTPEVEPTELPPKAELLGKLVRLEPGQDPNELLRHRYLCRGGGLLLCGPTGIGKSSWAMQCAILWALGRECFGIVPAFPLKSLLIQAENDDGDLAEMRDGVIAGLGLSVEEAKAACDNIMVWREDSRTNLGFFLQVVRPLLAEHRPDLLWIDPALAYLGGDANTQKDVGTFLRNGLNPPLREFKCGGVVIHHTNKPPIGKDKPNWRAGDFAYLGGGSAEWANWARAVLAIRSIGSHEIFELQAGKRGGRLAWRTAAGATSFARYLAHSKEPGMICWLDAGTDEVPTGDGATRRPAKYDLLDLIPQDGSIDKHALESKASDAGIGEKRTRGLLAELIESGQAFEWRVPRKGVRPSIRLARHPQPEPKVEGG